ncbi:zinc finger MYM-type protein 1-like [Ciona intestinalis]
MKKHQPTISAFYNRKRRIEETETEESGTVFHANISHPNELPKCVSSGRSLQNKWLERYSWIVVNSDGSCRCSTCCWGQENGRIASVHANAVKRSPWFLENNGWKDFRKGMSSIEKHAQAKYHNEAENAMNIGLNESANISRIDRRVEQFQKSNRVAMSAIIDALRYLGECCSAIRGHGDEKQSSNLWRLIRLLCRYNPTIKQYFDDDTATKFVSPDIQNEILSIISNNVTRVLIGNIKTQSRGEQHMSSVFSIIIDETSDLSNLEQVSVCIRYATDQLHRNEVFLGLYETSKTDASTLRKIVDDVLLRFGLNIQQLRGQGYDGGSNMSGKITGLQKRISDDNCKALYFHCTGHQLNLICQDACAANPLVGQAMGHINKIINYIKESPKRWAAFQCVVFEGSLPNTKKIRPLCPTRWVMRLASIDAVLENYENLLDFFHSASEDTSFPAATRSTALSFLDSLQLFKTYFLLRVLQRLFSTINPVHVKCQARDITIGEIQKLMNFLAQTLSCDGSSMANAKLFMEEVKTSAIALKLDLPALPRRQRSRNVEVDDYYMDIYKNVMQSATKAVTERYCSKSITIASKLHALLVEPNFSSSEVLDISNFYAPDWNPREIQRERLQWFARCKSGNIVPSIEALQKEMSNNSSLRTLAPNLHTALITYVVLPTSSCEAERSFSMLRRLKTYLRSTQTQKRLNSLAIIAAHRSVAEELDINSITNEFVSHTQTRRNRFGVTV